MSVQIIGIAKTWGMKNIPSWSEDAHRDLLQRHGATEIDGRVSAKTLDAKQIDAVLDDYALRGWPRKMPFRTGGATRRVVAPQDKVLGLIRALWIQLGKAGALRNSTKEGLLMFATTRLGREVTKLEYLGAAERNALVQALKSMQTRSVA